MSYRVNRAEGFQRWGVTNPWVFANYGQPQRKRGYVSPMVFQTYGPYLKTAHLGQSIDDQVMNLERPASDILDASAAERELLRRSEEDLRRSERMERYALAGVFISGVSLLLAYNFYARQTRKPVRTNRRRRRTSRRR